MSIWSRLGEILSSAVSQGFSAVVEAARTFFEGDPITRKQVAFSIAIVALSAKAAKADGIVTDDEIAAFHELFEVPPEEMRNVNRLYNLAMQDVAGFEHYAAQVKRLFPDDDDILRDVLNALFYIAKADGVIHELELQFIEVVAEIFGISGRTFEQIKLRNVVPEEGDPYCILGANREWDFAQLKKHYRKLVSENHPDKMVSRGVPQEFLKIANDRLAEINFAWDQIEKEHSLKLTASQDLDNSSNQSGETIA
ncbi:MAG: molecular chaperone DjiA [Rhizobiales bacterium]|nr:molecular chaperone DjiA [Hyphomicrobiales bacterium]